MKRDKCLSNLWYHLIFSYLNGFIIVFKILPGCSWSSELLAFIRVPKICQVSDTDEQWYVDVWGECLWMCVSMYVAF